MRKRVSISAAASALLLVLLVACSSGPPSITDVKMGKTKDVAQTTGTFDARDTLYAVADIKNPPKDGKVMGRLVIVNVEGQQPGPIPGLETTLSLTGGMNTANFEFTAPTAGWPNGSYQLEVILQDSTGAEKDKKTANFTTAGNQPPAAPATTTEAPADESTTATDTTATEETTTTQ